MEETELEEGEACFYENDASIDPDIALSYIDEKLQNVLGHFQKDFEGGVSAENLGSKFGGYGSFLPTHKLSPPAWSHSKSPQEVLNHNTPHSCNNLGLEGAPPNSIVPTEPAVVIRPTVAASQQPHELSVQTASASARKYSSSLCAPIGETFLSKNGITPSNSENSADQRSLKVRIKVGCDKTAMKNVAIYSGLGLISPSSSTDNTEESDGMPTVSHDISYESPGSILRDMTSGFVPGNLLLSPLNETLLCLVRKEKVSNRIAVPNKGIQKSSSLLEEGKPLKGKKISSLDKGEFLERTKCNNDTHFEGEMAPFSEKVKGKEFLDGKQCLTDDLKVKQSFNSVRHDGDMLKVSVSTSEAQRDAKKDVPVKKREMKKDWIKDRLFVPDLMSIESESNDQDCGSYGQKDVKRNSIELPEENQTRGSTKQPSVDSRESGRIRVNRVPSVCKIDSDVSKYETDSIAMTMDRFEKKAGKAATHEPHEGKVRHGSDKLPFEKKKYKLKAIQSGGMSSSKLVEEKKKSGVLGTMKDKNAQKDILKVRNSYNYILDTTAAHENTQTKAIERPIGNEAKDCDLGAVNERHGFINGVSAEAVPQPLEVTPAAPPDNWVGCDRCEKWRLLPLGIEPEHLPDKWLCSMATWLPGQNYCDISEDETTRVVQEMNHYSLLQSQNNLQSCGGGAASGVAMVSIGRFDHATLKPNSEAMPDRLKKFRPTSSSSSLIQTSHLAMDAQKQGQKRKSSSEMNQQVLEANTVNKSVALLTSKSGNAVKRHSAKVNGKDVIGGDLKLKRQKNKESDEHDYVTLNKSRTGTAPNADKYQKSELAGDVSGTGFRSNSTCPSMEDRKDTEQQSEQLFSNNEKHRLGDRLVISVKRERDSTQVSMKSKFLDRKASDNVEMHAKKRKLKDWQESQPSNDNHFHDSMATVKSTDRIGRKEKRLKISNTDVKEHTASKGEDKSFQKGTTMKIILPSSKDCSVDRSREKNQQQSKHRKKVASQSNLDGLCSLRKDVGSERNLVAVTSSSSKVSDSCRRAILQETKGSPVESVSSSPMRTLNQDSLSPARRAISRKGLANDGGTGIDIPNKVLAKEANREALRHVKGLRDIDASQRSGGEVESKLNQTSKIRDNHMINHDTGTVVEQMPGQSHMQALGHCESIDRMSTKGDADSAIITQNFGKGSSSRSKNKDRSSSLQRVKVKGCDPVIEQESFPIKMKVEVDTVHGGPTSHPEQVGDGSQKHSHGTKFCNNAKNVGKKGSKKGTSDSIRNEKPISLVEHTGYEANFGDMGSSDVRATVESDLKKGFVGDISMRSDSNEGEPGGGKLEVNPCEAGKQEELGLVCRPLSRSLEASGFNAQAFDGPGHNVSKVLKHPGDVNPNVKNVVPDCCPVKDLGVLSFVKEYASCQTAMCALKRAEESKEYADRLKISGFDYECNEAYFDAALKLLYAASLLEVCNSNSSKLKAMDQLHIYSTAAKHCKSCAQDYEKRKEVAAAALAYKCMEVANMKVVYCKSSITNRDRHDLQTSLQLVAQGESPSSSASDVDNLNNQATIDKAVLSKSFAHAGNHVVARNQAHFLRLFDFTSDAISAMEACRNTQKAYEAANVILEDTQSKDIIVSVKRVIDFSFQDVKEVVCLVQHAREAINRQGLSGGNNRD